MEFLSSGFIRFAAVSAQMRVNGTLPKAEAIQVVQPFASILRP